MKKLENEGKLIYTISLFDDRFDRGPKFSELVLLTKLKKSTLQRVLGRLLKRGWISKQQIYIAPTSPTIWVNESGKFSVITGGEIPSTNEFLPVRSERPGVEKGYTDKQKLKAFHKMIKKHKIPKITVFRVEKIDPKTAPLGKKRYWMQFIKVFKKITDPKVKFVKSFTKGRQIKTKTTTHRVLRLGYRKYDLGNDIITTDVVDSFIIKVGKDIVRIPVDDVTLIPNKKS